MPANIRRLVELGLAPALAVETAAVINAGTVTDKAKRRLAELGMVPREISELRGQLAGTLPKLPKRWTEIGVSPRLAREFVASMSGGQALSISGSPSPATVGNAYNFTPTTAGGAGTKTFAFSGTTPPSALGGAFSTTTGAITGPFSSAGNIAGTITVTDDSGSASLPVSIAVSAVASTLSAIDAGGMYATWAAGTPPTFAPDTSPVTVSATRSAFAANAGAGNTVGAGTLAENRTITSRLRQAVSPAAPNDTTFTADQVVLDDYVLASDSVSNLTSTLTGWKPIAKHRYAPRRLITGDYPVAISADHRDGIAAVVFSVTDGTTTLTQTVTDPVVANRTGDKGAVQEYQYTFPAGAMAAFPGRFTRNTKVYPRIGVAANVLNSADQTVETRSFCDQYDVVGTKWVIYVDAAGNDSTGVARPISDDATAASSPVATITGAITRARALMPNNRVSGLEIRLRAGTWGSPAVTSNTYQDANSAEVILTRDPAVAKANVTFSYGTAGTWYLSYLRFADINIVRTAAVFIGSQLALGTGGQVVFRDCNIDLGGFNNTNIIGRPHYYEGNCVITGVAGTSMAGTGMCWMQRGVTAGTLGGTTISMDNWDIAGCDYPNTYVYNSAGVPENGALIEASLLRTNASTGSGGVWLATAAGVTVTGIAMRNNVIEYYGAAANTGLRISADGAGSDTEHVVLRGNTIVGADNAGRANIGYDESTGTTRRNARGWRVEGLLTPQLNNKSDRFVAVAGNADSVNRTGCWSVMYGVGFRGTLAYYPNAGRTASFMQDYPGLYAKIANDAVNPINPMFTDNQATRITGGTPANPTYSAGTGGGTYSVAANSPAKNAFPRGQNKFDILGNVRPSMDTIGAYA